MSDQPSKAHSPEPFSEVQLDPNEPRRNTDIRVLLHRNPAGWNAMCVDYEVTAGAFSESEARQKLAHAICTEMREVALYGYSLENEPLPGVRLSNTVYTRNFETGVPSKTAIQIRDTPVRLIFRRMV